MEQSFEPGDKVRLKDGGPVMIVEKMAVISAGANMDTGHQVWCTWSINSTELRDMFPTAVLEKVKEEH